MGLSPKQILVILSIILFSGSFFGEYVSADSSGVIGTLFDGNANKLKGESIQQQSIGISKIQNNSISSDKIAANAVTSAKIDPSQIQVASSGNCQYGINEIKVDGSVVCTIPDISACTDTCSSLGYTSGTHMICGASTNCGTSIDGVCGSCMSCLAGDFFDPQDGDSYRVFWDCLGVNGGKSASCAAGMYCACTDTCASFGYTSGTHTICGASVDCGSPTTTDGYGQCGSTPGTCATGSSPYGSVANNTSSQTWRCYLDGTSQAYKDAHSTTNCIVSTSTCSSSQTWIPDSFVCMGSDGSQHGSCSTEGASCSYIAYTDDVKNPKYFINNVNQPFVFDFIEKAQAMCAHGNENTFVGCSAGQSESGVPCTDGLILYRCTTCSNTCPNGWANPGSDCTCIQASSGTCTKIAGHCQDSVNGVCGSSNGTTSTSMPTTNLCSVGTASAVSGTGPWTWTCAGAYGGQTVSCSVLKKRILSKCSCIYHLENPDACAAGAWWSCSDGSSGGCDGSAPTCNSVSTCSYKAVPACASTCKNGVSTGIQEPIECVDEMGDPCSTCTGSPPSYCSICG